MGKRSLGALLDMGSQRDMVVPYMACLPVIYSLQVLLPQKEEQCPLDFKPGICCIVIVLVWHQCFTYRTKQRTYLWLEDNVLHIGKF
jgi:hypothetical protein